MFSELSKKQHGLMTAWYLRKEPKLLGILSPAAFLVEIGKVLILKIGKRIRVPCITKVFL